MPKITRPSPAVSTRMPASLRPFDLDVVGPANARPPPRARACGSLRPPRRRRPATRPAGAGRLPKSDRSPRRAHRQAAGRLPPAGPSPAATLQLPVGDHDRRAGRRPGRRRARGPDPSSSRPRQVVRRRPSSLGRAGRPGRAGRLRARRRMEAAGGWARCGRLRSVAAGMPISVAGPAACRAGSRGAVRP